MRSPVLSQPLSIGNKAPSSLVPVELCACSLTLEHVPGGLQEELHAHGEHVWVLKGTEIAYFGVKYPLTGVRHRQGDEISPHSFHEL